MPLQRASSWYAVWFLATVLHPVVAAADTNTWTGGAGDRRWNNPENWSAGRVPNETDDVVFPSNSDVVFVDQKVCVRSLTLEDGGGVATALRPTEAGTDISIKALFVSLGTNCAILALGGGHVFINVELSLTNRGLIYTSGNDGTGPGHGGNGGSVVITAGTSVDNAGGEIQAGNGGYADTDGGDITEPLSGGEGGSVQIKAGGEVSGGTITAGSEGAGANGGSTGDAGKKTITASGPIVIPQPNSWSGGDCSLTTGPGGMVSMAGVGGTALEATDGSIFIDACPGCPIDLTANPPGLDVLLATESICIHGNVLLDPGVMLDQITEPNAILSGVPCGPRCSNETHWFDGLEGYFDGVLDESGWNGWDDDPAFSLSVTSDLARSGFRSLEVAGIARGVHEFCAPHAGAWSFVAWQYIPTGFASGPTQGEPAGSYFMLLNTYVAGGPKHESVRLRVDPDADVVRFFTGSGDTTIDIPIETDRWKRIQSIIDLDEDWTRVYYDDNLITEYPWTGGILGGGGGALDVVGAESFANGSGPLYYDDLTLAPIRGCGDSLAVDFDEDGLDLLQETLRGTNSCDPDTDDDGALDGADNCPTELNPLQENTDGDALGDACDPCPFSAGTQGDEDADGVYEQFDNCPCDYNPGQEDDDNDGIGNACDAGCGAVDITQSTDPNTVLGPGFAVACFDSANNCTVENDFARSFDLSGGATAGQAHYVRCVKYGVDQAADTVTGFSLVTVILWVDTNGGAPNVANLSPLPGGSITDMVPSGLVPALRTVDFTANNVLVPADATLVVTVESPDLCTAQGPDNNFFDGANDAGQSAPSYIRAPDCGIADFADLAVVGPGFPNQHMLMTVELDPAPTGPPTPLVDPSGLEKSRFISFIILPTATAGGSETALRINIDEAHRPSPPYSGEATIQYTGCDGRQRFAGPPSVYIESTGNPVRFVASKTQSTAHFRDWSSYLSCTDNVPPFEYAPSGFDPVNPLPVCATDADCPSGETCTIPVDPLLHLTGSAILPSSKYTVENLAGTCCAEGDGAAACSSCTAVSAGLAVGTLRWGDVMAPFQADCGPSNPDPDCQNAATCTPLDCLSQPDVADFAGIVSKFKGSNDPIKARAMLTGDPAGDIAITAETSISHVTSCVDAFKGRRYPYVAECCSGAPASCP